MAQKLARKISRSFWHQLAKLVMLAFVIAPLSAYATITMISSDVTEVQVSNTRKKQDALVWTLKPNTQNYHEILEDVELAGEEKTSRAGVNISIDDNITSSIKACDRLPDDTKPSGLFLHFWSNKLDESINLCGNILDAYNGFDTGLKFVVERIEKGYNVLIGPIDMEVKANQMCNDLKEIFKMQCFILRRLSRATPFK